MSTIDQLLLHAAALFTESQRKCYVQLLATPVPEMVPVMRSLGELRAEVRKSKAVANQANQKSKFRANFLMEGLEAIEQKVAVLRILTNQFSMESNHRFVKDIDMETALVTLFALKAISKAPEPEILNNTEEGYLLTHVDVWVSGTKMTIPRDQAKRLKDTLDEAFAAEELCKTEESLLAHGFALGNVKIAEDQTFVNQTSEILKNQ